MCPGHKAGMGTDQKPSWDKQGVTLSLADVREAPPNQVPLYPGHGHGLIRTGHLCVNLTTVIRISC